MSTHTTGPWYAEAVNGSTIGYWAVLDSDGYTICNPSPMGRANASLIQAAPDLLDALRACAEYLGCIPETAAGGDDEAMRLTRLASDVLARATGAA